jgi:hypothetical protein
MRAPEISLGTPENDQLLLKFFKMLFLKRFKTKTGIMKNVIKRVLSRNLQFLIPLAFCSLC